MKKWFYYTIAVISLFCCAVLVVLCVPFIAIGEMVNSIATRIMAIGDRIMEWGDRKICVMDIEINDVNEK